LKRVFAAVFLLLSFSLQAQYGSLNFNTPAPLLPYVNSAPEIVSRAAVLIDAETGTVLYAKTLTRKFPRPRSPN
jgi:D-alanyl-D-alanine carboxypeptidase